jgi:hypothetical protein
LVKKTYIFIYIRIVKEQKIPMTCHLSHPSSNQYSGFKNGGGERARTDGLLRARQALSQLSYTPKKVVGLDGVEPSTSRLSGVRSNQAELQALKIR